MRKSEVVAMLIAEGISPEQAQARADAVEKGIFFDPETEPTGEREG